MTWIWTNDDLQNNNLDGQRIAIIGYGSQGRAHALNLRDGGADLALGLRPGGASHAQALADGFSPLPIRDALEGADIIMLLAPDLAQPELYASTIAPALEPGMLLLFAHGYNIHFGQITPPAFIDIGLIAPKSPGNRVRQEFERGRGVPCLAAVHQDASDTAWPRTLAYAQAIGGGHAGILRTTFAEETETDLFGEQAVICGGVAELVLAGFDTLTDAGYSKEAAYFECLHELGLIVDLLQRGGLGGMHRFISDTASYGAITRGPRIIDARARENMKAILEEIRSGAFAREWNTDQGTTLQALLGTHREHPIEETGAALRARMPWLQDDNDGSNSNEGSSR